MSLSRLTKILLPTTFVAFTTAAGAAPKELPSIDLSSPIPEGTCVSDSPLGSAYDKIEAIKKARGQYTVIEANRIGKTGEGGNNVGEISFTSNLRAIEGKKTVFGEGYVIISDAPKGKRGRFYCIQIRNDSTQLASAITGTKVPGTVNVGQLGEGLSHAMINANSKVGYVAVTSKRTLFAVSFNYSTKNGQYDLADGEGNNILPFPLIDVDYSHELPIEYQRALGIPKEGIALSEQQLLASTPR